MKIRYYLLKEAKGNGHEHNNRQALRSSHPSTRVGIRCYWIVTSMVPAEKNGRIVAVKKNDFVNVEIMLVVMPLEEQEERSVKNLHLKGK